MKQKSEVNAWSVTWGVLMAMLFSAAAAYLGLKVGQVFEAAIPIAIIAVGVSAAAKRSNALRENVIIQSIGACSGAVVAGAIFTLPAIYILQAKYPEMSADFLKIFIASMLGGVLGILFLIPFRRYFVEAPQKQFPFPEATATTQVLSSSSGTCTRSWETTIRISSRMAMISTVYFPVRNCASATMCTSHRFKTASTTSRTSIIGRWSGSQRRNASSSMGPEGSQTRCSRHSTARESP